MDNNKNALNSMLLQIRDDKFIEFSDDLNKISTYFEHFTSEFDEPIPVLDYDDEIFKIFEEWFSMLCIEGIEKVEVDNLRVIFKPEFFKQFNDVIKLKLFYFSLGNQIKLLADTIAYVSPNLNFLTKDINKNPNYVVEYSKYINKSDIYNINNINSYSSLYQLIFPDGIFEIPNEICMNYQNLQKVIFSDTIEEIGMSAFSNCSSLQNVSAKNVKIIKNKAFEDCINLSTANFPNVERIYGRAFAGCHNLTKFNDSCCLISPSKSSFNFGNLFDYSPIISPIQETSTRLEIDNTSFLNSKINIIV